MDNGKAIEVFENGEWWRYLDEDTPSHLVSELVDAINLAEELLRNSWVETWDKLPYSGTPERFVFAEHIDGRIYPIPSRVVDEKFYKRWMYVPEGE